MARMRSRKDSKEQAAKKAYSRPNSRLGGVDFDISSPALVQRLTVRTLWPGIALVGCRDTSFRSPSALCPTSPCPRRASPC